MKKLITVLAILVVLVGAVFAANSNEAKKAEGTAKININAKVPETIPQFSLAIGSAEGDASAASAVVQKGQWVDDETKPIYAIENDPTSQRIGYEKKYEAVTVYSAANGNIASSELSEAAVKALTGNGAAAGDITVSFAISQVGKANLKGGYEISVTATDLDLVTFSDGTPRGTTALIPATQRFVVDGKTAETDTTMAPAVSSVAASVVDGRALSDGAKLTVTYDGSAQVAEAEIGTFNVTWKSNTSAVAGDYQATVVMTVASK